MKGTPRVVCAALALAAGLAGCSSNAGNSSSQSYGTISTVAGTGRFGYTGDGGLGTAAELSGPTCVALDTARNLYIGDVADNVVRKVTAATGIISTYAGTGVQSYTGDNGPATIATMYGPTACATDAAGNLYIADDGNSVIRKVSVAGIMTTVAGNGVDAGLAFPIGGFTGDGGPATSAEINHPFGVAVDAAGNLYLADTGNYRVRRVDAVTGTITTVAGNGTHGFAGDGGLAVSAELYNPEGLAVDAAGNLYIAEEANMTVRRVDAKTGIITTVAGSGGVLGFSGDGGPGASAQLNSPSAVAVDASGNVYISDTSNMRVRRVLASNGTIETVVGSGNQGYMGDGGSATGAELNNPRGIAFDASGAMYIADYANGVVRKVTP